MLNARAAGGLVVPLLVVDVRVDDSTVDGG